MIDIDLKKKLRFIKWAINSIFIYCFFIIISLIFNFYFLIFPLFLISLYYVLKVLKSYTERKSNYIRLYNLFSENPNNIKKSILYRMWPALCEREVAKQLASDFQIDL